MRGMRYAEVSQKELKLKPRHDLDDSYVQYCLQKKSLMGEQTKHKIDCLFALKSVNYKIWCRTFGTTSCRIL